VRKKGNPGQEGRLMHFGFSPYGWCFWCYALTRFFLFVCSCGFFANRDGYRVEPNSNRNRSNGTEVLFDSIYRTAILLCDSIEPSRTESERIVDGPCLYAKAWVCSSVLRITISVQCPWEVVHRMCLTVQAFGSFRAKIWSLAPNWSRNPTKRAYVLWKPIHTKLEKPLWTFSHWYFLTLDF